MYDDEYVGFFLCVCVFTSIVINLLHVIVY